MLGMIATMAIRPAVQFWLRSSAQSWRSYPTPDGIAQVHASGPDPDRVLVLGSGMVVGYGVRSHELAFGGFLARQLASLTKRGSSIDIVADQDMTARDATARLGELGLGRFDALVTTLGASEALALKSTGAWGRDVDALLDRVAEIGGPSLRTFMVGIAPITSLVDMPRAFRPVVRSRINEINVRAARACRAHPRATFIPLKLPPADRRDGEDSPSASYAYWATLTAPVMAKQLADGAIVPRDRGRPLESARQSALDQMSIVDTEPDPAFDQIVMTARDLFGVSGASVTILDHDRQWVKSAVGVDQYDTPRANAFCEVTVAEGKVFVVEDATRDSRFAGHPWVVGKSHVRFYAGHPIEAPDGHRIGALCLVDSEPRRFSREDATLLRELALRVQVALWGMS